MVFSSTIFLFLFLPLALACYYNPVWKGRGFRNGFLLLASLGFYAWGEPLFVAIMVLSILVNWALALVMARCETRRARKRWLTAAIGFDVALLVVFKYATFIARNLGLLFGNHGVALNIALPIGVSFFTFQIMSYVFDVYYKKATAQHNLVNLALYISMFPQLIAGPIVRYQTIAAEIEHRAENSDDFAAGMTRFVMGLGKKLLIANYAGFIADRLFALDGLSVASAWLGALAYSLQIYFDFSGYSDMAIGLGRLFGFHFLENFDYPYMARSITDFWRRWHISLSAWFRDYVYIPLGGSRVAKPRLVLNLLVVWVLTGVWHGANWTFVVWGLAYFALIAVERFTGFATRLSSVGLGVLARVYTLFCVLLLWVLFRAESLMMAGRYILALFGVGATGFVDETFWLYLSNAKWILLVGVLLATPVARWVGGVLACRYIRVYRLASAVGVMVLFSVSLLICIKATYNPFIYFNF
ncbi:MAG: MBOAT family protein [Treponema sp.]|jgi:D-alanyl-lipoteichoic acid acyltransferase DltB (MBOAT superfamily)|nr:MBOAT family protein [Treponema sp.]